MKYQTGDIVRLSKIFINSFDDRGFYDVKKDIDETVDYFIDTFNIAEYMEETYAYERSDVAALLRRIFTKGEFFVVSRFTVASGSSIQPNTYKIRLNNMNADAQLFWNRVTEHVENFYEDELELVNKNVLLDIKEEIGA